MDLSPSLLCGHKRLPLLRIVQDDGGLAVRLYRNGMILVREKLMAVDRRLAEALARLATVGPEEKGV